MPLQMNMRPSARLTPTRLAPPDQDKRADGLIKLADYYRRAMEARRLVGFRAFVALFVFYGAVLLQSKELLRLFGDGHVARVLLSTFLLVVFLAFLHSIREQAKRNESDRRRYTSLESEAWRILDRGRWSSFFPDFASSSSTFIPARSRVEQLRANWASTEGVVIGLLLLLVCMVKVWLIG